MLPLLGCIYCKASCSCSTCFKGKSKYGAILAVRISYSLIEPFLAFISCSLCIYFIIFENIFYTFGKTNLFNKGTNSKFQSKKETLNLLSNKRINLLLLCMLGSGYLLNFGTL